MLPNDIARTVEASLSKFGFETYSFKIGWYNDLVRKEFVFPYDYDTFAIVVISTPDMFEKGLVPFIIRNDCMGPCDLLDEFVKECFKNIKQELSECDIEAIHDFELLPSRRPRVLVQTAGHVAGAAYYYQRKDVQPDPWPESKNIYGLSIHPKFGGWFALRGVLIFRNVLCPDLVKKEPLKVLSDSKMIQEVLERFNGNWQDWTYRDIIPVEKKYSESQKEYFATLPKDRHKLIERLRSENRHTDASGVDEKQ